MGNVENKPKINKIVPAENPITITGILLVDDVRIMYDIINKYFIHYGHGNINIYYAQNGYNALDKLKDQNDINVILMDIKMSPINGYETTKKY